jgi:hypothetical protein
MRGLKLHTAAWMLVAALTAIGILLFMALKKEKENSRRLYENARGLDGQITELQTLRGQLMAENQILRLKSDELEAILPQIKSEIENLRIRFSRAQKYSETAFSAQITPLVSLRDSVIFDTIPVKLFDFQDDYFLVRGLSQQSMQQLEIAYRDTLIQVVYRGDRPKPWLWFFSKRPLMQRVALKNPNAQIHYSQVIEIED